MNHTEIHQSPTAFPDSLVDTWRNCWWVVMQNESEKDQELKCLLPGHKIISDICIIVTCSFVVNPLFICSNLTLIADCDQWPQLEQEGTLENIGCLL